jgi:undecaprenyl-diphosphatase
MHFLQILLLAVIQGFAELLPVSSSAHVIAAEKLMGLDPTSPEMTLLLVMLHTGTMVAVLVYFAKPWRERYFQDRTRGWAFLKLVLAGTLATGLLGLVLKGIIEKVILRGVDHAEVEMIFGRMTWIAGALAAAGLLILFASFQEKTGNKGQTLGFHESFWIGLVQGICLPFRGFSRSGATISTALILGISRTVAEDFSFALGVVLTPPVLFREIHRLMKAHAFESLSNGDRLGLFLPSLVGMVLSFGAGMIALAWLSSWLEKGRWAWFGFYCLAFAGLVWSIA